MTKIQKYPLTDKLINCGYCGRELLMFMICNGQYKYTHEWKEYGAGVYTHYEYVYNIFVCPACHTPTIIQEEQDLENDCDIPDDFGNIITVPIVQRTTLYPSKIDRFKYAPTDVIQSYETASKLLHNEPLACAVFVGRTLEFLCKDRKASGKTLDQMLKNLESKGEISQSILEMALSLKGFRNLAAHATLVKISKEDAELLLKICEVVIEYVYEVTQMLEDIKKRLSEKGLK